MENSSKNWLMPASIIIAGLIIAGAVIYSGSKSASVVEQSENQQARQALTNESDVIYGNPDAKIEIVVFGDFQCPFCAKFYKEIEIPLIKNYVETGKVRFVFKPLAFLDQGAEVKESQNSVLAVKCAQEQGKFLEFRDEIYEVEYVEVEQVIAGKIASNGHNGNLNLELFNKIAGDLGMNVDDFIACYNSGKYVNVYQENMAQAEANMSDGVGTPAVFVNGQLAQLELNANREFDFTKFSKVLDSILAQ